MKVQGLNITGTVPTRLTVDAEAIDAGAAAADDAMFISRILERTRGLAEHRRIDADYYRSEAAKVGECREVIDAIMHGKSAQVRALVPRGMLATRLLEVTLDVDRDAVHFLATVERWPAGDKKRRIAGFDLVLVPVGVEARVGGLVYFGRARLAGPCEGRVFPPGGWHHLNETHVFYLPICLDQPTDVGEDAAHGEART